jgi:ADP-heptose:LPS heptosyltransferase
MAAGRIWILKLLDATAGAGACRLAGRLVHAAHREIRLQPVDPRAVRRFLVIRPGGMGDMLMLLPALKRLIALFPDARCDVLCERRNRDVPALAGLDVGVLTYDSGPVRCLWRLLRTPYDVVVDTEQFHHFSAVLGWLSGASVRVGFRINPVRNPLYTHLADYAPDGPEVLQFGELLRPLGGGGTCADDLVGMLRQSPAQILPDDIEALLAGAGRLAAVHVGGSLPVKRWPLDRFREVADGLSRATGLSVVVVGDARDAAACRAAWGPRPPDGIRAVLAGRLSLAQTTEVIRRAALFVGGDSGLAHLTVAFDVPAVVIFGPSDRRKWGRQDARHAVVSHAVPCRPCCIFGYHKPCHTVACLDGVQTRAVLAAVQQVLGVTRTLPQLTCA